MTVCENLMKLYPTTEQFLIGRSKSGGTWVQMAKIMGISEGALYRHQRMLIDHKVPTRTAQEIKNFAYALTIAEIDKGIKKLLHDVTVNIVKVYKIVDAELFYSDVTSYDGLEFVREDRGATWNQICKNMMPTAIHRGVA